MTYSIHQMNIEEAMLISKWKYEEPYSIYSMDGSREAINELLDGSYYSVRDEEANLIGYYCYAESAQVPVGRKFGAYDEKDVTDIGLGMNPALCGQGLGYEFFSNGIEFAQKELGAVKFRLTVAAFNKRAIKVYERAGFRKVTSFERISKDSITVFEVMKRG